MTYQVNIVRDQAALAALGLDLHERLVADVETRGIDPKNGKLLGVALAPLSGKFADGSDAAYVVINSYSFGQSEWNSLVSIRSRPSDTFNTLRNHLHRVGLVGHNFCYDRGWIDSFFDVNTAWIADTRLMWHMSTVQDRTRPYALKDAQVEVLGWEARGDEELKAQVEARGGSLKKGDHYLADTDVLGYYAGLDAISTAQLYARCVPYFDDHEQWPLLARVMQFNTLLDLNTRLGVRADSPRLEAQVARLTSELLEGRKELASSVEPYVRQLIESWKAHQAAKYVSDRHRTEFLTDPSMWKRFNQGSDKQKRELFYGTMALPIVEHVKPRKDKKTGRRVYSQTPAVTFDAVTRAIAASGRADLAPMSAAYEKAEHAETMLKNFASPWLKALRVSERPTKDALSRARIHPPFNPCGTVTFRISGYKPYFLNLPFDERELMECFGCDEGFGGVHADLVSVEPAVTAHYSQDPFLLKVFRDGLGDVYLDLALTLFPYDQALREGYDPNVPVTAEVKERFKRQRKVAKIIQLAVQYTGTEYTVSASLTKAGFPTTLAEAEKLVAAYWKHFARVEKMNDAMKALHRRRGYLTNVVGRAVRVHRQYEKDVPNRLIQSSGHDILSLLWVPRIYELCQERDIDVRPILLDCHDSTSNQCPLSQVPALRQAYVDALEWTNEQLGMTVKVKADVKEFATLAGLKGEE